jgi:glutamate racemase
VVEPGAQAAVQALGRPAGKTPPPILVLATRATIRSGAYRRALAEAAQPMRPQVLEQECPLLVPMIEEGWLDHPLLHGTIQEYVSPHFRGHEPGVALLGCTHYPWIQSAIQLSLPGWKVVNSAQAVAEAFAARLGSGLASRLTQGKKGEITWIFTDPEAVPAFAKSQWTSGTTFE